MEQAFASTAGSGDVDAEVARLAKKYSSLAAERDAATAGVIDERAIAATQAQLDSEYGLARAAASGPAASGAAPVRVMMCPGCKGEKVRRETYNNFRIIERLCEECDGEGVLRVTPNGTVLREGDGDAPDPADVRRALGVPPPVFAPGSAAIRRRAVLRERIVKLEARKAAYHAEIASLVAQADSAEATATMHGLIAEVMAGIQGQLRRIGERIAELEDELENGTDKGGAVADAEPTSAGAA